MRLPDFQPPLPQDLSRRELVKIKYDVEMHQQMHPGCAIAVPLGSRFGRAVKRLFRRQIFDLGDLRVIEAGAGRITYLPGGSDGWHITP